MSNLIVSDAEEDDIVQNMDEDFDALAAFLKDPTSEETGELLHSCQNASEPVTEPTTHSGFLEEDQRLAMAEHGEPLLEDPEEQDDPHDHRQRDRISTSHERRHPPAQLRPAVRHKKPKLRPAASYDTRFLETLICLATYLQSHCTYFDAVEKDPSIAEQSGNYDETLFKMTITTFTLASSTTSLALHTQILRQLSRFRLDSEHESWMNLPLHEWSGGYEHGEFPDAKLEARELVVLASRRQWLHESSTSPIDCGLDTGTIDSLGELYVTFFRAFEVEISEKIRCLQTPSAISVAHSLQHFNHYWLRNFVPQIEICLEKMKRYCAEFALVDLSRDT